MASKYKIVHGTSSTEVAQKVEEAMAQGWQVQGGVSMSLYETEEKLERFYAQAVVR